MNFLASDLTDVLLAGGDEGSLHLTIYDSFELGTYTIKDHGQRMKLSGHASHPYYSTHALLCEGPDKPHPLFLLPLDLRMITETGRYLTIIASKSTHLQNILRYIIATQNHIYGEFKNSQDLPGRFIRNIEEALQEKDHCSFLSAVYHLVATGDCYETMKEWLVDELGDRVVFP